ncbi:hypothetical protein TrispH2_000675 [Trichoplax sp. H2]|nr:hypothetical protein TrispH2_000675 [Trichoplax sp. H2]|eukprot:RDD47892.1 hypothetical protein TrispH2_000675 [Trichoplax sp. H2]
MAVKFKNLYHYGYISNHHYVMTLLVVLLLLNGVASVIIGGFSIASEQYYTLGARISAPIWCGIAVTLSGISGLLNMFYRDSIAHTKWFYGLSIFAAVTNAFGLVTLFLGIGFHSPFNIAADVLIGVGFLLSVTTALMIGCGVYCYRDDLSLIQKGTWASINHSLAYRKMSQDIYDDANYRIEVRKSGKIIEKSEF